MNDLQRWILSKDLAAATVTQYLWATESFLKWLAEEGIEVKAADVVAVRRWLDSRSWGASSRHNAACAVKSYYTWRYGPEHLVCLIKVHRPEAPPGRTLQRDELARVFAYLDPEAARNPGRKIVVVRDRALIALLVDTGLRSSEACRLRIDQVDLEKCALWVEVKGRRPSQRIFSQKTASYLQDYLAVREMFLEWRRLQRGMLGRPDREDPPEIFISHKSGYALTRVGLRASMREIARKTGIPHFSPHALRRSLAVLAFEAGAPSRVVQTMGDWKSQDMVTHYSRLFQLEGARKYLPMDNLEARK